MLHSVSESYSWTEYLDLQQGAAQFLVSCSLDSRNAEIRGGYSKLCLTPSSSDFIVPQPWRVGAVTGDAAGRLQVGHKQNIRCRRWLGGSFNTLEM